MAASNCRQRIAEVAVKVTAYADLLPAVKAPRSRAQAVANHYQSRFRASSLGHAGVGDAGISAASVVEAARTVGSPIGFGNASPGFFPKGFGNTISGFSPIGDAAPGFSPVGIVSTTMGVGDDGLSAASVVEAARTVGSPIGFGNASPGFFPKGFGNTISGFSPIGNAAPGFSPVGIVSTTMGAGNSKVYRSSVGIVSSKAGFDPLGIGMNKSRGDSPYQYLLRRFLVNGSNLCGAAPLSAEEKAAQDLAAQEAQKLSREEKMEMERVMLDTMAKVLLDSWSTVGAVQKRFPFTGPFSVILNETLNKVIEFAAKGIAICAANVLLGLILMGVGTVLVKVGDGEGGGSSKDGEGGDAEGGDNKGGEGGSPSFSLWRTGLIGMLLSGSNKPSTPTPPAPTTIPIVVSPSVVVVVMGRDTRPFYIPAAALDGVSKALVHVIIGTSNGKDGCHGHDGEVGHGVPK